jgi:hypothetical protein
LADSAKPHAVAPSRNSLRPRPVPISAETPCVVVRRKTAECCAAFCAALSEAKSQCDARDSPAGSSAACSKCSSVTCR